MRKEIKLFVLSIALLMLSNSIWAQNIAVVNPGFENGLSSWITQAGGSSSATYSSETTDAVEGIKSLMCNVVKLGANNWDIQFMNTTVTLEEGVSYRASAWAKASTPDMQMSFAVSKASPGYTQYGNISNIPLTTEWQEYSFTFTSPVTTTTDARVNFTLLSTGTYWFDNIVIVESVVNKAEVSKNGKIIDIELVDDISDPSQELDLTFFVLSKTNGYKKVDAMMWKPSKTNTVRVTLSDTVFSKEEVTVTYYPGTIAKSTGNEIAGFSVVPVNGSTVKQPVLTSVKAEIVNNISLYPIPFTDLLNVRLSKTSSGVVEISDLTGRIVLKQVYSGQTTVSLNVSELKQGMFIIKIYDGTGAVQSAKKAIKK